MHSSGHGWWASIHIRGARARAIRLVSMRPASDRHRRLSPEDSSQKRSGTALTDSAQGLTTETMRGSGRADVNQPGSSMKTLSQCGREKVKQPSPHRRGGIHRYQMNTYCAAQKAKNSGHRRTVESGVSHDQAVIKPQLCWGIQPGWLYIQIDEKKKRAPLAESACRRREKQKGSMETNCQSSCRQALWKDVEMGKEQKKRCHRYQPGALVLILVLLSLTLCIFVFKYFLNPSNGLQSAYNEVFGTDVGSLASQQERGRIACLSSRDVQPPKVTVMRHRVKLLSGPSQAEWIHCLSQTVGEGKEELKKERKKERVKRGELRPSGASEVASSEVCGYDGSHCFIPQLGPGGLSPCSTRSCQHQALRDGLQT
ncbi:hypothetical protein JZ751_029404, partial [Albula glossodonta]